MATRPERLGSPALQEPLFTICQEPDFLGLKTREFLSHLLGRSKIIDTLSIVTYKGLTFKNLYWINRHLAQQVLDGSRPEALELLLGLKERTAEASLLTPTVGSLVVCRGRLAHFLQMKFVRRPAFKEDIMAEIFYFLGQAGG